MADRRGQIYSTFASAPSKTSSHDFPTSFPTLDYNETLNPTFPVQPIVIDEETRTGISPFLLIVLALCFLICCAGSYTKKSPSTASTEINTAGSTQQNATRRDEPVQASTSEDLVIEAVKKMSLSDRKLFLANALTTKKYKSSGNEPSSFRKVFPTSTHETCAICLEQFHDGEDICASPNHACSHVFHRDCVLDWLLTHEICPICRRNYLQLDSIRSTHELHDDIERGDIGDPSVVYPASSDINNTVAENPSFMFPDSGMVDTSLVDEPIVESVSTSMNLVDLHQSISGSTAPSSMQFGHQITI